MRISIKLIQLIKLLIIFAVVNISAQAQELLLDQQIKAGDLKLYPIYGKPKEYYYVPDKITVPNGPDGKKQFSFLKFSNDGFGDIKKGAQGELTLDGGGLVSFLVSFNVEEEAVRDAESELQAKVPGAKIMGPVTYKEGNFTLVSNFMQEDGDWATKVLGIGKAPVMEGHKAAVSMRLTKEGAIILWESFHQAASDISVSFEMNMSGYRNPYEADVVAYWDKVAKNRSVNIGSKSTYLGVDIQNIMKSLKDDGSLKVITKGEDEDMDKLWQMAYGLLAKQMFDKTMDPITLSTLQDDANPFSNFEKANAFNIQERDRIKQDNKDERAREESERQRFNKFIVAEEKESDERERKRKLLLSHEKQWPILGDIAREMESRNTNNQANDGNEENKPEPENDNDKVSENKNNEGSENKTKNVTENKKSENKPIQSQLNNAKQTISDGANKIKDSVSSKIAPSFSKAKLQTPPSFSLLASYRKKEFKKSGKFELSLKKWSKDTQVVNFDENIGGFGKRMLNDPDHFRVINLDDAAFKNRLILIKLESQDAEDFKNFVNFVSVKIRKTHQDGTKTNREYVITRETFNNNPSEHSIIYGYHGDKDIDQWKQYEYQVSWNLFGGAVFTSEWKTSSNNMIGVTPKHTYKEVTVEADPDEFADGKVRVATVKFKYTIFGKEFTREVSLKAGRNQEPTKTIQYAYEANKDSDYTYEVKWLKKGNIRIQEPPQTASDPIIYLEVPEGE